MRNGVIGIASTDPTAWADFVQTHESDGAIFCLKVHRQRGPGSFIAVAGNQAPWTPHTIVGSSVDSEWGVLIGEAFINGKLLDERTLLTGIKRAGGKFASELSGLFTLITWESEEQRLTIATDRLATQKIYTFRHANTLLFSSEIKPLLRPKNIPRSIDPESLAQFLVASHPLDERSLIKDIVVCKPASLSTWTMGQWKEEPYWLPEIGLGENDGLDAWADRLASVIGPSVESLCDDPLLLPLTGGLDSRVIAAFLPQSVIPRTRSCSFGHSHCYDVRYGRRIAHSLGTLHRFLPLRDDFFKTYLPAVSELGDGEISIEALPMLRLLDAAEPGTVLLSGYLGDTLSGSSMPDLNSLRGEEEQFNRVWHRYFQKSGFSEEQLSEVLKSDVAAAVKGKVTELARRIFNEANTLHPSEKIIALKLRTRQWRFTSYMSRILGTRYRFRAPFLDNTVMDTFLAMPISHRLNQRAYRRMLVRHSPKLAALPEQKTHKPVTFTDEMRHSPAPLQRGDLVSSTLPASVAWRVNALIRGLDQQLVRMSMGWLGSHNRDYYVHHDESIRSVAPGWFREWLLERGKIDEFFQRDALESLLNEHMSGKRNHAIRINNIVSFLAWREDTGL